MIPAIVEKPQLLAANGVFTLTLNAAFALGFALLGPLVVNVASPEALILIVGALYFLAAAFCFTLPKSPPPETASSAGGVGAAAGETVAQLREGLDFIRGHRAITWSLIYLGIAASLVGVLGVLGPEFARESLGLSTKDFVVVVLPLGFGVVIGVLLLNSYGKYIHRRRVIEFGLMGLGLMLAALSGAGPISRLLQRADAPGGIDLSAITSLLAVVVVIALLAGIAYAFVAIPSQTQLQEDLPEDVRGRVFGILNMLVSVSSFLPIIIAGYISDHHRDDVGHPHRGRRDVHHRHRLVHPARARCCPPRRRRIRMRSTRSRPPLGRTDRPGAARSDARRRTPSPPPAQTAARRTPAVRPAGRDRRPRSDPPTRWTGTDGAVPLDALITGRIATLAGDAGFGWVEAIGIRDGRVAFAGSAVDLETRADPHTERLDLAPDEVAIPGLTDAHLHFAAARARDPAARPDVQPESRGRASADPGRPRGPGACRRPGGVAAGARLGLGSLGRLADGP